MCAGLVLGMTGELELERRVLDVEVTREAVLQLIEKPWCRAFVEA